MAAEYRRVRFRRRGGRFWRNLVVFAFLLALLLTAMLWALSLGLPFYVYLLAAYPVYLLWQIITRAYGLTHPQPSFMRVELTPAQVGLPYEKVDFASRDGLNLFGWYVPGQNRAAVILVHPFGARGVLMLEHAAALAQHGYAVFMFDLRAHGSSEGDTCTLGWLERYDLLGALDYVQGRPEVDPDRIGVLGISLGAQIALRTAAEGPALRAVVAESTSTATLSDHGRPDTVLRWLYYPLNWLSYNLEAFFNGARPTSGLVDTIGAIAPRPVLLISAGRGMEQRWLRRLYAAAREPRELWELPQAKHAECYAADPATYTEKITAFFDRALHPTQVTACPGAGQGMWL